MSEILLLGAGASVEAGVPGAYAMTKKILDRFRTDQINRRYGHVLSFVVGGLLFEAGKNNHDPLNAGVNVEDLFNAVQLLAERNSLEAAPFVGSWHTMVEEFDKIYPTTSNTDRLNKIIYKNVVKEIRSAFKELPQGLDRDKIDRALASSIKKTVEAAVKGKTASIGTSDSVGRAVESYVKQIGKKWSDKLNSASPSSGSDLDRELKGLIDQRQAKPGKGRIFHRTNARMIETLKDLVWIERPEAVTYLGPILNLLRSQKRLVVATLNYDNGMERLAESQGLHCETGIDSWSSTGIFDLSGDGLFLLKLHGSIDWTWEKDKRTPERLMPHSVISRVSGADLKKSKMQPAVIFGQRNKLTAEGPFLDLLRSFREELSHSDTLTVVGYSFRDPHINVYISQWLNADLSHRIRIVCGENFESEANEYTTFLLQLRERSTDQVTIVPHFAGSGLKEIYGALELSSDSFSEADPLEDRPINPA